MSLDCTQLIKIEGLKYVAVSDKTCILPTCSGSLSQ